MSSSAGGLGQRLLNVFFPPGAPLWLLVGGNAALVFLAASFFAVVAPHRLVAKVKPLRRWRKYIFTTCRRFGTLTMQGPFVRGFIFTVKTASLGFASFKCKQPQALELKASSCCSADITWVPRLPWGNVFHEERYICSFRVAPDQSEVGPDAANGAAVAGSDADVQWREGKFKDIKELKGNRLTAVLRGLNDRSVYEVRICAKSAWGRGPWSDVARVVTYARPIDGGLDGPLGVAAADCAKRRYHWTQTQGEVGIRIPIPAAWTAKDIDFKCLASRIEVQVRPRVLDGASEPRILLKGDFPKRVKPDEVFWEIDENTSDGRHLSVQMAKTQQYDKWPCLLEGHTPVDVGLVKLLTGGMKVIGGEGIDVLE